MSTAWAYKAQLCLVRLRYADAVILNAKLMRQLEEQGAAQESSVQPKCAAPLCN
jgi:hypothetical protein